MVVVVGGGAAGLLAAGRAAAGGLPVVLLEAGGRCGRKLRITGKGRCNVTNCCTVEELVRNVLRNGRFLYGAFSRFDASDAMAFFESIGVPLKVERGNRVFPQSDDARQVVDALVRWCKNAGVQFVQARADGLEIDETGIRAVLAAGRRFACSAALIATGGLSYPLTGSTGDGYRLAQQAGHAVNPPAPSLVPLCTEESWPKEAQGQLLKNVTLTVFENGRNKQLFCEQGELLLTHFGISGPLTLSASAQMRRMQPGRYTGMLDLKPALSSEKLDARLLREQQADPKRELHQLLRRLLPGKLVIPVCKLLGWRPDQPVNQLTRQQRQQLGGLLKRMPLTFTSFRPIEEAIVTAGGVDVREVNPRSMESKKVPGLYFAGEILDVDGYTGGFNLQIAWSTAATAADSLCEKYSG